MDLVGRLDFDVVGKQEYYYSNDNIHFYKDMDGNVPLSKEELENWAVWINSEWSQDDLSYKTKLNCKDGYTEMNVPENKTWKTAYSIVGYEGVYSDIIGYGSDEIESLMNCMKLFDYLQKEYNQEDKSI